MAFIIVCLVFVPETTIASQGKYFLFLFIIGKMIAQYALFLLLLQTLNTFYFHSYTVRPDFCSLPPVTESLGNPCKGYFRKWTFNAIEETCQKIIYGGCHGTQNLFDSEDDCKTACGVSV